MEKTWTIIFKSALKGGTFFLVPQEGEVETSWKIAHEHIYFYYFQRVRWVSPVRNNSQFGMISIEFRSLPLVIIPRQNLGKPCERLSTFTEVTFKQNTNLKRCWWGIRERLNQRFAKLCM